MTKMVITEKGYSKRRVCSIISQFYQGKYTFKYKRGQIYVFFPNKDLAHSQAERIARTMGMTIISESHVRVVIGF